MKTLVRHFTVLALIDLILSPLVEAHASSLPADSTYFCQPYDSAQWERDRPRPAAKRLDQESEDQPEPPFSGTVWIDPDIITPSDPTALEDITAAGRGHRTMFDRRANDWITINAYLFNARFDDGLTTEIQVNPEFGSASAALAEANKYGRAIGQLPTILRTDVETVWIHKGDNPAGGRNNNILIHVGSVSDWRKDFLEETLVHEAAHTSLDARHSGASAWTAAQKADGNYISTYARDYPRREDIAESFLSHLAVRYRSARISPFYERTVLETIPNRIAYFDQLLQISASNAMHPITEDLADEQPFEWPPELVACSQQLYESNDNGGEKWVDLEPYNPNQLSRFLPITAGKETEIIFVNNNTIEVLFYWLDYDRTERYYGRVAACDSTTQGTFAGHIWRVKDQHGKNLAMFQAEAKTGRAFIGSQTPPDTVDDEQQGSASAQLAKISGDGQQGPAGAQLDEPFVVSVLDADGAAMAGVVVTFSVTAGRGTLSATTATTDTNGRARTTLTSGREPGTNTVVATVEGLGTETFTAIGQATTDSDGEEADGEMAFAFVGEIADQAYTAGTAISALVLPEATGGEGEITYRVSELPAGLSFDNSTRTISGTPGAATDGAVEITYTAEDSAGVAATLTFSITVNPALSFGDLFNLFGE